MKYSSLKSQEGALSSLGKRSRRSFSGGLESSLSPPHNFFLCIFFSSFLQLPRFIAFLFLTPLLSFYLPLGVFACHLFLVLSLLCTNSA